MISKKDKPALLLIDIQKGFDELEHWGDERNNPQAEENASQLLKHWRANSLPIFHIQHCSTEMNSPLNESNNGNEFKDLVKPKENEPIIKKSVNSAFIGTSLKEQLDKMKITTLVIVGLTTDHCVSTTTRMAGNFGYTTYVVHDATATFSKKGFDGKHFSAELIHETAIASLKNEFATILSTDYLIQHI